MFNKTLSITARLYAVSFVLYDLITVSAIIVRIVRIAMIDTINIPQTIYDVHRHLHYDIIIIKSSINFIIYRHDAEFVSKTTENTRGFLYIINYNYKITNNF